MNQVEILENLLHAKNLRTIKLSKPPGFEFEPGQFVVLQDEVDSKPTRRSYSIASGPNDEELHIYFSVEPRGLFTQHLDKKKPGETLQLIGPFGQFTEKPGHERTVMIASGTGISPFLSMLKQKANLTSFALLLSVRDKEELCHMDLLREFQAKGLKTIIATTREQSEQYLSRRFNSQDLAILKKPRTAYYLCGSTPFVKQMQSYLEELGVDSGAIVKEKYGNIRA